MIERDMERIMELHNALRDTRTVHTGNGKLLYYLDANGRYQDKENLLRLLNRVEKIGMLEQIAILEEPFSDEQEVDVSDLPVRVAADESLQSVEDALARIELGYRAIALKPAGKTLSMSILIGFAAAQLIQ